MSFATALAHPNIALIKYWGDVDSQRHIPANGSISVNLDGLTTLTSVRFDEQLPGDQFTLDERQVHGLGLDRVSQFLDRVRSMAGIKYFAHVESQNNFPTGAGIASSASGFAALSLASSRAAGLDLDQSELSRLARTGSGSACRSIPTGFVEWHAGSNDRDSYAESIAPPDYWDLADCIVVVSQAEKQVTSGAGHALAKTSPLQPARVADAYRRLKICRDAVFNRDFDALAKVIELDSNLMHAVMITSNPHLLYWQPETVRVIQTVQALRKSGFPVCYTVDAGPNVHVLCLEQVIDEIMDQLKELPGVIGVRVAHPGGPATLKNVTNGTLDSLKKADSGKRP